MWLTFLDDDSKVCSDNDVSATRTWQYPFSYFNRTRYKQINLSFLHAMLNCSLAAFEIEEAEHALLMYVRSCCLIS